MHTSDDPEPVRKYPDRIVGTFMLNLHLGVEAGLAELRRLVDEDGFRMVKLHPTAHPYWPKARDLTDPVLEEAARINLSESDMDDIAGDNLARLLRL